jgi:hypothetical protein
VSSSAVATLLQVVQYADSALDVVLPLAGQSDLVVVADAVNALVKKIAAASAGQTSAVSAEIAAADLAAKAAEAAAGLK